jgi:UDP-GlcNAc:undecaprenyl-phosphate/decaprenyl-phosphate GlcNAc-1-phosphate transferase
MLRIFLISFIGSVVFTRIAMTLSEKLGILDHPDPRKIHSKAMPLLGGAAIFCSYMAALLINFHFSWKLKGVVIASTLIFLTGIIDDIKDVPAGARLLTQIAASCILIYFGVHLKVIPNTVPLYWYMNAVITVVWVVGITNAVNFIDGVDGMAAGVALIASGTFFVIAYQTGQSYFAFLNIALAGSCLGFLFYNLPPARIFLGDSGSGLLGFSLASFAAMGDWARDNRIVSLSIPVLVLAILIFDMAYISIARVHQGKVRNFKEWIEYVGRDHLQHRLMALGLSPVQTVFFVYLVCVIFSISAIVLKGADTFQAMMLITQCALILAVMAFLMIVGRKNLNGMKGE